MPNTYYTMSDVTSVQDYQWGGKDRPNINDYVGPWNEYASGYVYENTLGSKRKEHNSAVAYAQNKLAAARVQYDSDMAFWNERDERDYTDPFSQANRLKEAGFNLGYMYSTVDSGNSAVGYNQESSDYDLSEANKGHDLEATKMVVDAVMTAFDLATNIARSVGSISKIPHEIALMKSQGANQDSQAALAKINAAFESFMQSHDDDGNKVNDMGKSLAFSFKQMQYGLMQNQINLTHQEWIDKVNWNKVSEQIYKNQSAPTTSEAFSNYIMSLDIPDYGKAALLVIGSAVGGAWSNGVKFVNPKH